MACYARAHFHKTLQRLVGGCVIGWWGVCCNHFTTRWDDPWRLCNHSRGRVSTGNGLCSLSDGWLRWAGYDSCVVGFSGSVVCVSGGGFVGVSSIAVAAVIPASREM